ncbi:unnamed protein product [Lymnaea stagnalis]|uniref:RanBP-type and C3HC4-type zinc finger-containing protein 1 n=1 Tax=Lymnaea stagnalis TaxID=6523 RepID=A0AAV2IQS4_LYMST
MTTPGTSTSDLGLHALASDLVIKLSAAIQGGDVTKAKELVDTIANLQLKLEIIVPKEDTEQRSKEKEFSIRVHVEDRVSDGCHFNLMVKACDTIEDLKKKVMLKHNFPVEVQRWIIGKKIFNDKDKLGQCGIKGPGHTLYLYLVTARSVGLTRENYEIQRQAIIEGKPFPVIGFDQPGQPSPLPRDEQGSWAPAPLSPGSHSTISNLYLGLSPEESEGIPHNVTSRQVSKRSLSSGSSMLQEMMSAINIQGSQNSPNSIAPESNRPRSVCSDSNLSSETAQDRASSGYRSRTPPRTPPTERAKNEVAGWQCSACTLINLPTRPGCEACSGPRPITYQIPVGYQMTPEEIALIENDKLLERMTREAENLQVLQNYQLLMAAEDQDLIQNHQLFECPICFEQVDEGDGIVLRECLHMFCKDCLKESVRHCEDAIVKCPFQDESYSCASMLQEREIKALVPKELYERFLQRGLDQAESRTANAYHCKTADCHGWCVYEDLVNFFQCPVCNKENCLTCKAIHEGLNCKQYQDNLRLRALNDSAARQTKEMLEKLVKDGEAMHCPQCLIVLQKKGGCDWIKCSICKTEICWVTKGRRWGLRGEGDTSGGCKCRVNGNKCHPLCVNCH